MKFEVVISEGEDGWYVVECPSLPGCISQGKTVAEALENIKEAIVLYLEPEEDIKMVEGMQVLKVAV